MAELSRQQRHPCAALCMLPARQVVGGGRGGGGESERAQIRDYLGLEPPEQTYLGLERPEQICILDLNRLNRHVPRIRTAGTDMYLS